MKWSNLNLLKRRLTIGQRQTTRAVGAEVMTGILRRPIPRRIVGNMGWAIQLEVGTMTGTEEMLPVEAVIGIRSLKKRRRMVILTLLHPGHLKAVDGTATIHTSINQHLRVPPARMTGTAQETPLFRLVLILGATGNPCQALELILIIIGDLLKIKLWLVVRSGIVAKKPRIKAANLEATVPVTTRTPRRRELEVAVVSISGISHQEDKIVVSILLRTGAALQTMVAIMMVICGVIIRPTMVLILKTAAHLPQRTLYLHLDHKVEIYCIAVCLGIEKHLLPTAEISPMIKIHLCTSRDRAGTTTVFTTNPHPRDVLMATM